MKEVKFCYCCRVHHPIEQMQLFPTRQGNRWRCLSSIQAATRPHEERDRFGLQQTAINRAAASRAALHSQKQRHLVALSP
jgi:hypothetical protein